MGKTKKWYHDSIDWDYRKELNIDWLKILIIGMIGFSIILLSFTIYDTGFIRPYASENAISQCREMGYNSYESFERLPLSKQPMGLKCEQPVKPININGAIPVEIMR